jgi:formate dehydrogenase subunit delta
MDIQRLIHMANDIARFYRAEPDREAAVNGVLTHLQRFWDPRMRREIRAHWEQGGADLDELVHTAVARLEVSIARSG